MPTAERLAAAFWPGPLTLVLPRAAGCPVAELATAGLDTIAVRVPAHPVARDILAAFGRPVVAPSANRSGHVSPTTAATRRSPILRGRIDLIIDGGPTPVGVEFTIVACLGEPMLLRPGGVPRAEIERVLACQALAGAACSRRGRWRRCAPGMLASHYAPRARLRLDARRASQRRRGVAGLRPGPGRRRRARALTLNLSPRGDLIEAAANLFSHLRALDAAGAATIAVMPVPHDGPRRGDQRPAGARPRRARAARACASDLT